MKTYTFHVSGTHCIACKALIEDILSEQTGVTKVTVNLHDQTLTVEGENLPDAEKLASEWSDLLSAHKYLLSVSKQEKPKQLKAVAYAVPLGIFILGLFFLLQKSGIVNLGFEGGLTPVTALMIGIIASLSTCLALVGGLILSLSATISDDVKTTRPFVFFHIGRIISFVILGGILGEVGSVLSINPYVTAIFGLLVALVMIILGINLLDVLHITKKLQFTLPQSLFARIKKIENGFFAPFIVGSATFFLPCGFTQSMQLAALSSGSFWSGSLIMTMFVLGTTPMLAFLSFGSFRFAHTRYASFFFKTAGVVVVGLGIFSLLGSLAGLGIIKPLFNI